MLNFDLNQLLLDLDKFPVYSDVLNKDYYSAEFLVNAFLKEYVRRLISTGSFKQSNSPILIENPECVLINNLITINLPSHSLQINLLDEDTFAITLKGLHSEKIGSGSYSEVPQELFSLKGKVIFSENFLEVFFSKLSISEHKVVKVYESPEDEEDENELENYIKEYNEPILEELSILQTLSPEDQKIKRLLYNQNVSLLRALSIPKIKGTLLSLTSSNQYLGKKAHWLFCSYLFSIYDLHKKGILHNDLKFDNGFLNESIFQWIDYGLSLNLKNINRYKEKYISGTPPFFPPERPSFQADITENLLYKKEAYTAGLVYCFLLLNSDKNNPFNLFKKYFALNTPSNLNNRHMTNLNILKQKWEKIFLDLAEYTPSSIIDVLKNLVALNLEERSMITEALEGFIKRNGESILEGLIIAIDELIVQNVSCTKLDNAQTELQDLQKKSVKNRTGFWYLSQQAVYDNRVKKLIELIHQLEELPIQLKKFKDRVLTTSQQIPLTFETCSALYYHFTQLTLGFNFNTAVFIADLNEEDPDLIDSELYLSPSKLLSTN